MVAGMVTSLQISQFSTPFQMPWLEFLNMSAVDKQVTDLTMDWDIHCNLVLPEGMRIARKGGYRLPRMFHCTLLAFSVAVLRYVSPVITDDLFSVYAHTSCQVLKSLESF